MDFRISNNVLVENNNAIIFDDDIGWVHKFFKDILLDVGKKNYIF